MLHGNPPKEDDKLDEETTRAEESLEALSTDILEIPSVIRNGLSASAGDSVEGNIGATNGAPTEATEDKPVAPTEPKTPEVTPDVPDDNTIGGTSAERSVDADVPVDRAPEEVAEEVTGTIYEVTAYVATCDGCTGVTYSGYDVRQTIYTPEGYRVIATDPAVIPTGTLVQLTYADGRTETARAEDIGSGINGHEADLLVAAEAEALEFGRQDVNITIIN